MGWASYVEDIKELRDDLADYERELEAADKLDLDVSRRIASYRQTLNGIVRKLDALLSLATDPSIELASEIEQLRSTLQASSGTIGLLRSKLETADSNIAQLKADLKKTRKAYNQLNREYDSLLKQDLSAAVDLYPPKRPDDIGG